MNNKLDDILLEVAEETFESLVFMLLMPEEEAEEGGEADTGITAKITFAGPFAGALFLTVSSGMLGSLVVNMLGLEEDDAGSPAQQEDALKELLNVICGNVLPAVAGVEAVFDVQAGEILAEGGIPETLGEREPAATARLNLDMGVARLSLFAAVDLSSPADAASTAVGKEF